MSEWVKGALRPRNAKRLYTDEKSTEKGEIKEKNRKEKEKILCFYFVWPLSYVSAGGLPGVLSPARITIRVFENALTKEELKAQYFMSEWVSERGFTSKQRIYIRVIEVRNPPTTKWWTVRGFFLIWRQGRKQRWREIQYL